MKTRRLALLAATLIALSGGAFAHGDDHTPKHGGIVVETKAMDYEIVVKADAVQLYLRDHGKPVNVAKATGKMTLLQGKDRQEVALQPAGDKLEAKGTFKPAPGTKGIVQVNLGGKSHSARFALK